jgi:hypothetical protein
MKFERRDVWDVLWSEDSPDLFAMMEKSRMSARACGSRAPRAAASHVLLPGMCSGDCSRRSP